MQRTHFNIAAIALALVIGPAGLVQELSAQDNIVPNPGFEGETGAAVDAVTGTVPDNWRAFAVGGGAAEIEVVPIDADELYDGSPATNAVLFRVNTFGADQGFDDDNGRFALVPQASYHAEFYVRTGNADESDQTFNFGFPIFGTGGYLGKEPGGATGNTATSDWQLVVAPIFENPVDSIEGHISWRPLEDGGEDAILIAMPWVAPEEQIVYPTALTCLKTGTDVELSWVNNETYDQITILRNGEELETIDAAATTYTDTGVPEGDHEYQVLATFNAVDDGPTCQLAIFVVDVGTTVSVDLGEEDQIDGLENSQRDDGTDGETTFVICGPEDDLREARSNWGNEDPTPDAPDGLFYFNVLDPPMKAQDTFRLAVTVYDDPVRAGAGLYLQYTNQASTGPGDIANTFYPLADPPTRLLEGTDAWVVLTWEISGAGFRTFMQSSSDIRLGVTDGGRLCIDKVELTYFPTPTDLSCTRTGTGVELAWTNNGAYENIAIFRDDEFLEELPGDAVSYPDDDPPEGDVKYDVRATVGELEGGPTCTITVFMVPEGTRVSVDLGEIDEENGLENSQRQDGGDGENEFVLCGPADDTREARSNYGGEDPTFEFPDPFFYFNVTDAAMKAQGSFHIEATVYDDPARAGVGLALQYTNAQSTGPGDIPNTFFPQADAVTRLLDGTDAWVVLSWDIEDAGFRTFMQGSSDIRLGVTDGGRLCIDKVEFVFPSGGGGPAEPVFHRGDANADGQINITDGIFILNFLFLGGDAPPCTEAANANDDNQLNITDGIYVLNFLFLGGPAPTDPGPPTEACGPDPEGSPNDMGCESYPPCETP